MRDPGLRAQVGHDAATGGLERWPPCAGGERFTSVGSWRAFAPVEFDGRTCGQRVHEFRRLAPLPRLANETFELALKIDPTETSDLELLAAGGWNVVDPLAVSDDPAAYQRYIQGSRAEFMVAKNMYVATCSGWFSDRSMCYLASGKPVLRRTPVSGASTRSVGASSPTPRSTTPSPASRRSRATTAATRTPPVN
jgi:hypothetical protein